MIAARNAGLLVVASALALAACGGSAAPTAGHPVPTTLPRLSLNAAPSAAGQQPAIAGPAIIAFPPNSYVLDRPLRDLGPSAEVWRETSRTATAHVVAQFATALGLAGTPVRTGSGYQVQAGNASLSFSDVGGSTSVSFGQGSASAGGSPGVANGSSSSGAGVASPPPLPSQQSPVTPTTVVSAAPVPVDVPDAHAATVIATDLLTRAGALGGTSWATTVNGSGGVAVSCPAGVPCPFLPPTITERTVTFTPKLKGIAINDPVWTVSIGAHGHVDSLYGEWTTFDELGAYPLRPTAAVFHDLEQGRARFVNPQPMLGVATPDLAVHGRVPRSVVHVTGVTLGLARWFGSDNGKPTTYVVPTYRFDVREGRTTQWTVEVLALDPAHFTIANSAVTAPTPPVGIAPSPGAGAPEPLPATKP